MSFVEVTPACIPTQTQLTRPIHRWLVKFPSVPGAVDCTTVKTALGMMALQLRIADFKFTHNFIICSRLPDTEILFGIDIQKKVSLSYAWDKEKNCYIQKDGRLPTYTRNCEQKATIGTVKSNLKIPPQHNGIIWIKIKGYTIPGHMAYFISNLDSKKGKISK